MKTDVKKSLQAKPTEEESVSDLQQETSWLFDQDSLVK